MKCLCCLSLLLLVPLRASAQDATPAAPDTAQALAFELIRWEQRPYEVEHFTLDGEALQSVKKTYTADFGTLAVPERRGDPAARTIELPLLRIRATGPQPASRSSGSMAGRDKPTCRRSTSTISSKSTTM